MHLLLTPVVAFVEHTRAGVTQLAQEHVFTPEILVSDDDAQLAVLHRAAHAIVCAVMLTVTSFGVQAG